MPTFNNSTNTHTLNQNLPSISEALAVPAGCTLLLSSQNAPFVQGFNYTAPNNILPTPAWQHFPATLQTADYAIRLDGTLAGGLLRDLGIGVHDQRDCAVFHDPRGARVPGH